MQSGRGMVPQVLAPAPLAAALQIAAGEGHVLFLYERAVLSLKEGLRDTGGRLFVFIGPEGGFAEEEAKLARSLGAKICSLGPRILRTETAPIAALSAAMYEKGEMTLKQFIIDADSVFLGKTIRESGIRDKYHCMIAGVEREDGTLMVPDVNAPFEEGDVVWVVGEKENVYQLVDQKNEKIQVK